MRNSHLYLGIALGVLSIFCMTPPEAFSKDGEKKSSLSFLSKRILVLGDISKDTILTKEFRFKNGGDAPLIIEEIYKSCSCANYKISSQTIYPNSEGLIIITIDTKAKIGIQEITLHLIANTEERDHIIKIIYNAK